QRPVRRGADLTGVYGQVRVEGDRLQAGELKRERRWRGTDDRGGRVGVERQADLAGAEAAAGRAAAVVRLDLHRAVEATRRGRGQVHGLRHVIGEHGRR